MAQTHHLLLLLILIFYYARGQYSIPPNWWLKNNARQVTSAEDFQTLLDGNLKHKFIFIDFYMQHCKWCYLITDDFNKLIEDTESWFGKDAVAFLKVDG